jgi:hypothetical protein
MVISMKPAQRELGNALLKRLALNGYVLAVIGILAAVSRLMSFTAMAKRLRVFGYLIKVYRLIVDADNRRNLLFLLTFYDAIQKHRLLDK